MANAQQQTSSSGAVSKIPVWVVILAWLWAGLPLAWGVSQTLMKAAELFK